MPLKAAATAGISVRSVLLAEAKEMHFSSVSRAGFFTPPGITL